MSIHQGLDENGIPVTWVRLYTDQMVNQASKEAIFQLMKEEIEQQLVTDPSLRILVREMIKESIAKLNLQQIVDQAVEAHLRKGIDLDANRT